ncbi:MAG: isopentenyl phosphate kinase [Candidatus Heimdallarchaeaceae archaeon]
MNEKTVDVIKIGGSVITDKGKYATLKMNVLQRICKEISNWNKHAIIIHGAGSFGHIVAEKYDIVSGFKNDSQIEGLIQIRFDMMQLNTKVVDVLRKKGMKAMVFQTSSIVYSNKNEFMSFLKPMKKALELGITPVLSGDINFDEEQGFSIYSGDKLIKLLTEELKIRRVIFCTDVDGLWVKDGEGKTQLLKKICKADFSDLNLVNLTKDEKVDVTGTMEGKIEAIRLMLSRVKQVVIVNGLVPGRLQRALNGKEKLCTIITQD